MKIIILLSTILLTACNVDYATKSRSENCSLNGRKVDCKTFSPVEGPKKITLKASITAAAEISETRVEILENAEDSASQGEIDCSLSVFAGQIFTLRKSAGVLFVKEAGEGEEGVYFPTSNSNEWQNEIIDGNLKIIISLTLVDGKFKSSMICSENQ